MTFQVNAIVRKINAWNHFEKKYTSRKYDGIKKYHLRRKRNIVFDDLN
ncbi:MAG: hypothetical protein R2799_13890 [Crocinitomicaceae bacterium]